MTRFKLFAGTSTHEVEDAMNAWAEALPEGSKVRRTQLAAAAPPDTPGAYRTTYVYALVSYEPPPEARP